MERPLYLGGLVLRGKRGRRVPLRLGTLDPAVKDGREGRRARRGAYVGASRQVPL